MSDQVQYFVGVAGFVVVPGNQFHEVVVQCDTCFSIEHGSAYFAVEVGGNHVIFGVTQNAFHFAFSGFLDSVFDLLVGCCFFQTNGQVNNGYVRGRNAERHTSQFAVQFRQHFTYSFSSSGRGRDDVLSCATAAAPVFVRRAVNGFLSCGGRVNGGHQTFDDAEVVVDNFRQRCQAVGGAGSVGHDVLACIFIKVSATNEHRGVVFGRASQNNFFRASGDVFTCGFVGQEDTGCFSNHVHAHFVPLQVSRVFFSGNADFFTVNDQMTVFNFNGTVETTVSRVILQHVGHVVSV